MSNKKKTTVLLLHGMAFTSKNWLDIKTIPLLAAMGYHVIAIDLPGKVTNTNSNT